MVETIKVGILTLLVDKQVLMVNMEDTLPRGVIPPPVHQHIQDQVVDTHNLEVILNLVIQVANRVGIPSREGILSREGTLNQGVDTRSREVVIPRRVLIQHKLQHKQVTLPLEQDVNSSSRVKCMEKFSTSKVVKQMEGQRF
jgi:Ser-tRNA(Ala) deacylase AlaX